jgi:meckelin
MDLFGYYIHGRYEFWVIYFFYKSNCCTFFRSPHGFSDTDMCSMMIQFRREEENMCGHRGLLPGSEQQTYTILIPRNLRNFYEKLIAPTQMQQWQHRNSSISVFGLPHQENNNNNGKPLEYFNFEKTLMSHQSINKFLSAFIDHVRDFSELLIFS